MTLGSASKNNHKNGLAAEDLASKFLQEIGFELLEKRYKTSYGEIDLIARQKNLLIFVEVKRRKNNIEDDPISAKQKQRITNAALHYLSNNPEKSDFDMRFDSILIDSQQRLTHIIDSWRIEI